MAENGIVKSVKLDENEWNWPALVGPPILAHSIVDFLPKQFEWELLPIFGLKFILK